MKEKPPARLISREKRKPTLLAALLVQSQPPPEYGSCHPFLPLVGFVSRPSRRGDFVSRGNSVVCGVANSGGFAKELGLGETKQTPRRFQETRGFHEKKMSNK